MHHVLLGNERAGEVFLRSVNSAFRGARADRRLALAHKHKKLVLACVSVTNGQ